MPAAPHPPHHPNRRAPGTPLAARQTRRAVVAAALALPLLAGSTSARAEVIELLDKTRIAGTILHYYDGVFSVRTGENTVKVPREKIRSITYDLPKPRAEFATPRKTFERWQNALGKGDLDTFVDCYALMYQGFLMAQVGQSADAFKKMQDEIKGTTFTIKNESKKTDSATLTVQREKGDESDTGDIAFVRENGEWKMLPPQ